MFSQKSRFVGDSSAFVMGGMSKSRDCKERQVDRKKRKAIRQHSSWAPCPKQRQSPPGNIKKWVLIPGGNTSI